MEGALPERARAARHTPQQGEVRLTKNAIKVADLRRGSESELRHLLESIVLQANSDTAPDAQHNDDSDEDHEPDLDEQMAATFRAFAADNR